MILTILNILNKFQYKTKNMITETKRIENEHYLGIINNLQHLLLKELNPQELIENNRYGLSDKDQQIIREKIMDCVKNISL